MADLLERYFEEDLTLPEEDQIQSLLENSAEEASRFAGLALAHYASLGLQAPRWSRRRPALARLKSWRLPLLLLAAGGAALWALGSPDSATVSWEERESLLSLEEAAPAHVEMAELPAEPAKVVRRKAQAASGIAAPAAEPKDARPAVLRGSKLELVLNQAEAGPLEAWVEDSSGRRVKELFKGEAPAGTKRVEWDGKVESGRNAGQGEYTIVLKSTAGTQRRVVGLKARWRE